MKNFLLGLSIDVPSSPYIDFSLGGQVIHNGRKVSGSGLAWYPNNEYAAIVAKDPKSFAELGRPQILDDQNSCRSTIFMTHMNGASWNPVPQDTEPYCKPLGKRDWVWMHQGTLDISKLRKKKRELDKIFYEPVGNTDSETAFCIFLNRVMSLKARNLKDIGWDNIHDWLKEINGFGSANFFISDGSHLIAYCGLDGENTIYRQRIKPPYQNLLLKNEDASFSLDFRKEDDNLQTMHVFSTLPVTFGGYKEMKKGQMIVTKKSKVIWNSHAESKKMISFFNPDSENDDTKSIRFEIKEQAAAQSATSQFDQNAFSSPQDAECNIYLNMVHHTNSRVMKVTHETTYKYSEPVEKSEHVFRLIPMYNRFQQVLEYSLDVSVPSKKIVYRDVFNNDVISTVIEKPYTELNIKSQALVRIHQIDADDFSHPLRNSSLPVTWMPWQRQMMQAYIMPHELPETQLRELSEYANSFVDRNDGYLFDSLSDMNRTIYEDYKYKQGVTDFSTTAFDVYSKRQGVCQDFANLLICLARLLNVPARYRMGYIYTGADYQNKIQSEATHAWAELYIPYVGWRGFDPTNGKQVNTDYIRVASGRNYIDATPTSGTIYKGGGDETLTVTVKTEVVEG